MTWRGLALGLAFVLTAASGRAADTVQGNSNSGNFSAKSRQADLAHLRDFVYPPGYSEQTIVALENGEVPADLPVHEYVRLHCGEANRVVLYPCMMRYADDTGTAYYVVAQGANKRFTTLADATAYFHAQMSDTASHFHMEIAVMNTFVEEFCAQIAAGERAADILRALGGDRPRINHPIAPPDPDAKYQFSNLFSWDKCKGCVGIIAVNQPSEPPAPSCGTLRKQAEPHIAYFVVDRDTSRGHRSLDDGIGEFTRRASKK
jgi:hypothetical protein